MPSARLRRIVREGYTLEYFKWFFDKRNRGSKADFPQYLSVVAIVKNETAYIAEWLEYHLLVGVEKFYIYDNNSTDNLKEYLEPYIKAGIVEYTNFPGRERQVPAYNDALKKHRYDSYWLAYIDIDEFLVPVSAESLPDFLHSFEGACGVSVNWLVYGDNGHNAKIDGLVIERFKAHAETNFKYNHLVKVVHNPRYLFKADVHSGHYWHNAVNASLDTHGGKRSEYGSGTDIVYHDKLRLHHYWSKSYEEYLVKKGKGRAVLERLPLAAFEEYNRNDVKDDTTMDKYVPLVKESLAKRFAPK
ncbi:hypothetical protein AGMMS49941_01760 [Deferribacterales bacterium]|nr:hypothetical protein AGMMS49941_01760 [Deferribacterales bacterium]